MIQSLNLTSGKIDLSLLAAQSASSQECGAVVTFLGVVRGTEAGELITGLEYESFLEMAEHQFRLLFAQLEQRWPVASLTLTHRLGFVPAGEPSLYVKVAAPHRHEAFAACEWLIDEMKKRVPIWKKAVKAPAV
jgi:molybdopterin synthase catalytic subunit